MKNIIEHIALGAALQLTITCIITNALPLLVNGTCCVAQQCLRCEATLAAPLAIFCILLVELVQADALGSGNLFKRQLTWFSKFDTYKDLVAGLLGISITTLVEIIL